MELRVDVDEADIGRVREGQKATFTVDAFPGREFAAGLVSVRNAPKTVAGVVTYEAILDVDNGDLRLRPGLTAVAEITADVVENCLAVPNRALRFRPAVVPEDEKVVSAPKAKGGKTSTVWILQDGKPVAVEIATGATDGDWTEVLEGGISPGTAVLVGIVPRP